MCVHARDRCRGDGAARPNGLPIARTVADLSSRRVPKDTSQRLSVLTRSRARSVWCPCDHLGLRLVSREDDSDLVGVGMTWCW